MQHFRWLSGTLFAAGFILISSTAPAFSATDNVEPSSTEPPTVEYLLGSQPVSLEAAGSQDDFRSAQHLPLWRDPRLLLADALPEKADDAPVTGSTRDDRQSYLIPAVEVPTFVVLLNAFDRLAFPNKKKNGKRVYNTDPGTFWHNLTTQHWNFDKDKFDVNQFGHPYEGATMYGLARSCGLNFWTSLLYSNAGSFLWEMGGETSTPSINDIITTGNAGSLLGEALYRMANLVLERGGERPSLGREVFAAAISPPTGFNRYVFGDRFKEVYPSRDPATFRIFHAGASFNAHLTKPTPSEYHDVDSVASFAMAYGLPGKSGYGYRRPFDYFNFEFATRARTSNLIEALTVRGLLWGSDYAWGDDYRGVWGLYGSYDYIAPYLYRTSSTALSLGSTAQYWLAPGVALQGSLLAGFGYAAAGTDTFDVEERGYHYGATPQGLLALNLLFGDRVMIDFTGRAYYVSDVGSDHAVGADFTAQGNAGLTVRLTGRHAVTLRYVESVRDTNYYNRPDRYFSEGTFSLVYTFLSDTRFGAVEWRDSASR